MLPNFLCIGAVKSGTSWLYQNIRHHPGVWMPPVKEIHYFDDPERRPIVTKVFTRSRRGWRARQSTNGLIEQLRPKGADRSIRWHLRYLFKLRSDAWYESLFEPAAGQIAGDVTPGYCRLRDDRVAHIHSLLPHAKIIYILRNPIEREWAQAAMRFFVHQGKALTEVARHDLDQFLKSGGTSVNSDYLNNLTPWESHYPAEQIHIGFFDQLDRNPRGFLKSILEFLEQDSADHCIPESVGEKRNPHSYPSIPDDVARHLAEARWELLTSLHQRFDNEYTADWLRAAERWRSPV